MSDNFDIDQNAILERIQNFLTVHRMSQRELCENAKVDPTTFSKFKTYKNKSLGTSNYFRLASAMFMTAEELLYGTLPMPNIKGIDNNEKSLLRDFRMLDADDKKIVLKIVQRLKESNIFANIGTEKDQ